MAADSDMKQSLDEPKRMVTYKRADGELVWGEYSFLTDIDGIEADAEDADDPIEYVEEVWERKSVRTFVLPTCKQCDDPATHWGLCEKHAREDDPSSFDDVQPMTALEQKVEG